MSEHRPRGRPRTLDEVIEDDVRAERLESLHGPDSEQGRELGRTVGANLAKARTARDLSLDELSARTHIDAELLEQLEAGLVIPSMRACWHIATALGVPFGALLQDDSAPAPDFRVQRADSGRVIASSTNEFRSRVMFREGDPRSPEVYELTLTPGCLERAEPHAPGTFEHITVVAGELVVRAGDREARLAPGDAIFFRADRPHSYHNPGDAVAVAHLVMRFDAG